MGVDIRLGYIFATNILVPIVFMAIPVIVLVMSLTLKNNKAEGMTKNKALSIFVMIFLFILGSITFISSGIPVMKDMPRMSSHNFSSIDGTVLKVSISSGKAKDTTIIIRDRETKEQKTIRFSGTAYRLMNIGDNIKVSYLPNSLEGLTYTKLN